MPDIHGHVAAGYEAVADAFAAKVADGAEVGAAAAGKQDIPVRWLLTHQAGLAALDRPVGRADALAWHPMVDALAAQRPLWEPGTRHGYHALTYGWLVGEVVRRITGRSLGAFFRDEIAQPFGLDFHIGLPKDDLHRVARLVQRPPDFSRAAALDRACCPSYSHRGARRS